MKRLITTAFCICAGFSAFAQVGVHDPTFGTYGQINFPIKQGRDHARDVLVQPDGKILVGGLCLNTNSGYEEFALARFLTNGVPDSSFDGNGKVATVIGTGNCASNAIGLQSDGKIIAAGYARNSSGNFDFALVRYNTNGIVDSSFGTNGRTLFAIKLADDMVNAMAVQPDDKILLAGTCYNVNTNHWELAIARFTASGVPDTTFDQNGKLATVFSANGESFAQGITVQPDGKIIAVGFSNETARESVIARYHSDGRLDSSFAVNGTGDWNLSSSASMNDGFYTVKYLSSGKILCGGYVDDKIASIIRLNSDGSTDSTFAVNGLFTQPLGNTHTFIGDLEVQANGNIVYGGWLIRNGFYDEFYAGRCSVNGISDNTFANYNGYAYAIFSLGENNPGQRIALQADEKIIIVGDAVIGGNSDFGVVRLGNDNIALETINHAQTTASAVSAWPNPSSDVFTLSFNGTAAGKADLIITDMSGRIIHSEKNISLSARQTLQVNAAEWSSGLYFATIRLNNSQQVLKLVRN